MRIVPRKSAAAAPTSGLMPNNIARPNPGKAMCDTTSPAKLIRFIKAKLPTSPAARAVSRMRQTEYVSGGVTIGLDWDFECRNDCGGRDDKNRLPRRTT